MENEQNEWTKSENPEVEKGKDEFAEAQQAEDLRAQISLAADAAVQYGRVDRDWANNHLNRMGAPLVTGPSKYQINAPIDGVYGISITANTRAEALEKFKGYFDAVINEGEFRSGNYGQGVYQITSIPYDGNPVFFSGPQDIEPTNDPVPGLDGVKAAIHAMLKEGVTEKGWRYSAAVDTLHAMGLEALPHLTTKSVSVPVNGTAQINVQVFEGDSDEAVQRAAAAVMGRSSVVPVKPEEIGLAFTPRPDSSDAGFTLVDDDDDDAHDGAFED